MALRKFFIRRKLRTGPRFAQPEDRLRSCLEGRAVLIQPIRHILPWLSCVLREAPRLCQSL
jgi:hypothetical protein